MARLLLVVVLLLLATAFVVAQQQKVTPRQSRLVDEKVKNLDEATKRRVLAMQQAGMPKEAIAKKISYVAGGEGTARRMVDKINTEEKKKTYVHQAKQRNLAQQTAARAGQQKQKRR